MLSQERLRSVDKFELHLVRILCHFETLRGLYLGREENANFCSQFNLSDV